MLTIKVSSDQIHSKHWQISVYIIYAGYLVDVSETIWTLVGFVASLAYTGFKTVSQLVSAKFLKLRFILTVVYVKGLVHFQALSRRS